jgi:hypothetical protein
VHFLPSTILLKSNISELSSVVDITRLFGTGGIWAFLKNSHLYGLVACLLLFIWRDRVTLRRTDERSLLAACVLIAIVLHLQIADTGYFFRYEAYLVGIALTVLSIRVGSASAPGKCWDIRPGSWLSRTSMAVFLILAICPLVVRSGVAHSRTIQATRNIYQQQYQMGLFLRRHYDGESIAANDVGAINYLARLHCLDLWGVGSREVMTHRMLKDYSKAVIEKLGAARGVRVAVLYASWFRHRGLLPEEWTEVGTWTIRNNVVCGGSKVSFLALDPAEVPGLLRSLESFAMELPRGVTWQRVLPDGGPEGTPAPHKHRAGTQPVRPGHGG